MVSTGCPGDCLQTTRDTEHFNLCRGRGIPSTYLHKAQSVAKLKLVESVNCAVWRTENCRLLCNVFSGKEQTRQWDVESSFQLFILARSLDEINKNHSAKHFKWLRVGVYVSRFRLLCCRLLRLLGNYSVWLKTLELPALFI